MVYVNMVYLLSGSLQNRVAVKIRFPNLHNKIKNTRYNRQMNEQKRIFSSLIFLKRKLIVAKIVRMSLRLTIYEEVKYITIAQRLGWEKWKYAIIMFSYYTR